MDLARALVDAGALCVAQVALDVVLVGVTVGAVDLHRVRRGREARLGGEGFGHACLARVALPLVLEPTDPQIEQARHLIVPRHACDHLLHQLLASELLPKRLPPPGVRHRGLKAGADEAGGAGCHREPAAIEAAHGDLEPLALLTQTVLDWYLNVGQADPARRARPDPQLAVDVAGRHTGHLPLDDECGQAPMGRAGRYARRLAIRRGLTRRRIRPGEDEVIVGHGRQADPHLLTVEDVHVTLAASRGADPSHVGAGPGLGQAECRVPLAQRLRHQPALLLFLAAPLEQAQAVQPHVHAHHHAQRGIHPLQLLARQPEADVIHPGAAVPVRDAYTEDAQRPHAGQHLRVGPLGAVELFDGGRRLTFGELAHHPARHLVLWGQGKVHSGYSGRVVDRLVL